MSSPFAKASISTSRVQLTAVATAVTRGVRVTAMATNTGTVYVGDSAVTANDGIPLSAGQSIYLRAFQFGDASSIYLVGSASGQEVRAWVDATSE